MTRPLEAVGVTEIEEKVYRALLRGSPPTMSELVGRASIPEGELAEIVSSLQGKGLVSRSPDHPRRLLAAPPDTALEILILRKSDELQRARIYANDLLDEYSVLARDRDTSELIEIVTGGDGTSRRTEQLQRTAKEEVLIFDKPPYVSGGGVNSTELELLERGIRYRCIYDRSALEWPGQIDQLRAAVDAGEEARTYPELPMRLGIADRTLGLIPVRIGRSESPESDSILVHASPLLDSMIMLFELLWAKAAPIQFGASTEAAWDEDSDELALTEEEVNLLVLIAADLKEEAIARQLGMARRTVQRRTRRLMDRVGASTRVQLVVEACRRSWI